MKSNECLADDLLVGAAAIAQYVYGGDGASFRRKTYYAAERGHLPVFRIGRSLMARKSELRATMSAHGDWRPS